MASAMAAAALVLGTSAHAATVPGTVVNVVDGDTVDVQLEDGSSERIRLIGIDTPERGQCFGSEASAHARELLADQPVAVELDPTQGERDFYGRTLAYLWLPDGRNFGEVMLADGFANEYTYDQPYAYVDSFKAAQDAAIANRSGVWSPGACGADSPRFDPNGPDRDCGDFSTHAEAQDFFLQAGGPASDRHRLDGDHDGIACENLP